jgi:hypothetical protein
LFSSGSPFKTSNPWHDSNCVSPSPFAAAATPTPPPQRGQGAGSLDFFAGFDAGRDATVAYWVAGSGSDEDEDDDTREDGANGNGEDDVEGEGALTDSSVASGGSERLAAAGLASSPPAAGNGGLLRRRHSSSTLEMGMGASMSQMSLDRQEARVAAARDVTMPRTHESAGWFMGIMSEAAADHLLLQKGETGSFVVRGVSQDTHTFMLSVRAGDGTLHMPVVWRPESSWFELTGRADFRDLVQLVNFYRSNVLARLPDGGRLRLTHGFGTSGTLVGAPSGVNLRDRKLIPLRGRNRPGSGADPDLLRAEGRPLSLDSGRGPSTSGSGEKVYSMYLADDGPRARQAAEHRSMGGDAV